MKFNVKKSDLEFALATVAGAMGSEGDFSSHVVFRMKPGTSDQVEVLAAYNRIYAQCAIPKVTVLEEGEPFTIEGWRLRGWVGIVGDVDLEFETLANAEIQVTAGKYTQRFRSLDATNFHWMDKTLAGAISKGTIRAKRLATALQAAKSFTSTDESRRPDVVVVDIKDGLLMATDKSSVIVFFTLKDLPDCSMRVHVKDISGVAGFLDPIEGDIEILDANRIVFMKRLTDGAIYGETRYQVAFPNLSYTDDSDQAIWTVKTDELRKAALHAYFGASKTDKRLFLTPPDDKGLMKVSMKTDTATGVQTHVPIECTVKVLDDKSSEIPKDGFPVSYPHVMALLDAFDDATIDLGVNVDVGKKKRYIRVTKKMFVDEKDGTYDRYIFVLAGMVW